MEKDIIKVFSDLANGEKIVKLDADTLIETLAESLMQKIELSKKDSDGLPENKEEPKDDGEREDPEEKKEEE